MAKRGNIAGDSQQITHFYLIPAAATIPIMDASDTLSFDSAHHNTSIIARIIMMTDYLRDVLQDLDSKSDFVEFVVCPKEKTFSMSTFDAACNFTVEIPFDSEIVSHSQATEYVNVR